VGRSIGIGYVVGTRVNGENGAIKIISVALSRREVIQHKRGIKDNKQKKIEAVKKRKMDRYNENVMKCVW